MTNHELPHKVEIGGYSYLITALSEDQVGVSVGICHRDTKMIELEPDAKGPEAANTTLHEVLHAIWYERDIYQAIPAEYEELVVSQFATGLVELSRRNPDFMLWFLENAMGVPE